MSSNTGVFVSADTDALFNFHFNKCWVAHAITVYNDYDAFVSSQHDRKVACFQMPYPVDPAFENRVRDLRPHCDHVLILMSELHDRTVEFVQRNDHKQISYFICGDFNWPVEHSPVHKFYDWFTTSVHFYKHVRPELLKCTLHPYNVKPKMFDALLGRKKAHRDIAYNSVNKEQNIVTYLDTHDCDFNNPERWRWERSGLVVEQPVNWTVDRVNYHGYRMTLSQIAPLEIYNETAYTLIAETSYSNHYTFYTEKTVKPILGQRLFITLAGQSALKNLRNIGFQTFNGIIDESYDNTEGLVDRCYQALEQVRYLESRPQEEILEKIRPICEHNYSHMMRTDWYVQYFMPAFVAYFVQT